MDAQDLDGLGFDTDLPSSMTYEAGIFEIDAFFGSPEISPQPEEEVAATAHESLAAPTQEHHESQLLPLQGDELAEVDEPVSSTLAAQSVAPDEFASLMEDLDQMTDDVVPAAAKGEPHFTPDAVPREIAEFGQTSLGHDGEESALIAEPEHKNVEQVSATAESVNAGALDEAGEGEQPKFDSTDHIPSVKSMSSRPQHPSTNFATLNVQKSLALLSTARDEPLQSLPATNLPAPSLPAPKNFQFTGLTNLPQRKNFDLLSTGRSGPLELPSIVQSAMTPPADPAKQPRGSLPPSSDKSSLFAEMRGEEMGPSSYRRDSSNELPVSALDFDDTPTENCNGAANAVDGSESGSEADAPSSPVDLTTLLKKAREVEKRAEQSKMRFDKSAFASAPSSLFAPGLDVPSEAAVKSDTAPRRQRKKQDLAKELKALDLPTLPNTTDELNSGNQGVGNGTSLATKRTRRYEKSDAGSTEQEAEAESEGKDRKTIASSESQPTVIKSEPELVARKGRNKPGLGKELRALNLPSLSEGSDELNLGSPAETGEELAPATRRTRVNEKVQGEEEVKQPGRAAVQGASSPSPGAKPPASETQSSDDRQRPRKRLNLTKELEALNGQWFLEPAKPVDNFMQKRPRETRRTGGGGMKDDGDEEQQQTIDGDAESDSEQAPEPMVVIPTKRKKSVKVTDDDADGPAKPSKRSKTSAQNSVAQPEPETAEQDNAEKTSTTGKKRKDSKKDPKQPLSNHHLKGLVTGRLMQHISPQRKTRARAQEEAKKTPNPGAAAKLRHQKKAK